MPEFRTSKQRRMRSKSANENNKVSNKQKPEPLESKTHSHIATSRDETMDVNGNLHLDSLPTHEEQTSVTRNEFPSTKSIESENQGVNVTNRINSNLNNRSDYSLTSLQSTALEVHEHQGIGNDAPCGPYRNASSKVSSSDTSKTTLSNDFNHMASQEPAVAIRNQRNLSVSVTGQMSSGFRSSCQRKPTNLQNPDGNIMQRDFNKRHGISVHVKTGFNKKRHISSEAQPFPAAPFFNLPGSHLFPPVFPYGSHIPQLNLTEHQRLPMWNVGCDQHSPLPLHQLTYGVNQAGKQLQDKNYGNAFKEKYSRNSNQDQPGKTNRFQNRFKSRNYSSPECSGINNPPYKNMTQFEKDGQHSKSGSVTFLPDVRSKGTAGNHGYSDSTGALLTESVKHTLTSSKYGEKSGNQKTRYFEYGEIKSQLEQNGVADMKQKHLKTFQMDSNNSDTRTSTASQVVQRQTPSDMYTPREYPNTGRNNQTDQCGVQGYRSTCIGKTQTGWCHPESCDTKTKQSSCNVLEQTNATRNHPVHANENVQCEKVSNGNIDISAKTNTYTHFQTLPPYFDPTVHPLQVFQKGQGMDYNHRQLRQSTEKPFSECTPPSRFIPQNANVSNGCSNSAEYKEINYANEHQVPLNVVASSTVNANSRFSTTYSGSNSYTSKDCNSTMNPSHVIDMADASNTSNGTNSSNPGSMTFSSTINEEIEEEMTRAQRMSIPVIHGSERCPPLNSRLNPNANDFSPTLTDCNGNQFTMTKQHGVCYFKRDLENSFVTHQESNTSHEHEVAEVLVSTSDSVLKTYYTDNHVLHKEGGSPFFPTYHQQTECYGSDHPLYDYCTAPSDVSFNTSHVVYNTGQQLTPYNPKHIQEPTLPASNQMHQADNYFVSNNNYFNETCSHFFTPVQSPANHSQVLPSSEVQIHQQSPYTNPGFTCSFVPMYMTPSSASTTPMTFSGTEYCPVLMQNPGVPFTVSLPAHVSSQPQPSHYSAPEQVSMTCSAQNYSFQAPVFNLQAYFEATQNNPPVDPNTSNHVVLNTDLPNTHTQNIGSYAKNRERSEKDIHSETAQNENTDSTVHAETSHMQINIADTLATSNIHDANSQVNSTDLACENTTVSVSNVHIDQESVKNMQTTPEFDECKTLLLRLRHPEITLEKCRQNISLDSEKRYIEWLELALRVIERNANKLTIDEMVSIMMSVISEKYNLQ